jgi:hypothetical protein
LLPDFDTGARSRAKPGSWPRKMRDWAANK